MRIVDARFGRSLLSLAFLAALVGAVALSSPALAQFGGGGGGGGGFGGGGGGGFGGGGGGGGVTAGGVVVDANGVMSRRVVDDPRGELAKQRIAEAMSRLEGDLAKPTELRKVSITRLEQAIKDRLEAGGGPTDEMLHLAGLTRIDYVFCYPETGDIVLAGPAEPWAQAPSGRMLGIQTGSPVLQLQDLIAALRTFPAGDQSKDPLIYCSIDPTEEGLARMQQFLVQFGRQATPSDTQFIVDQLRERLGLQVVTVGGVPADTHFAPGLVEADYRMKLIGIGLEKPHARIKSYVARANPSMIARNAMQRWFFVPDYERLKMSDDGLAVEIVGEGVKLIGEDEMISRDGSRTQVGATNRASQAFVTAFTKNYSKLAERSPVFAQLRNCIDLAITAALIRKNDYHAQAGWSMDLFSDEEQYPIRTYNAPEQVASAVNSMWKGSTLMTPIGGGVQIQPSEALLDVNLKTDESGDLSAKRDELGIGTDDQRWWWD